MARETRKKAEADLDVKVVKKIVRALNKTGLMENDIGLDGDAEEMVSGLIAGMEEIDQDGKLDEVPDEVFEFYEEVAKSRVSGDDSKKAKGDDDPAKDGFDRDELEDELKEMDYRGAKKFVEENELDVEVDRKEWEDPDDIIEEILDAMEEKAEAGAKKGNSKTKAKTDGADDSDDLKEKLEDMTKAEIRAYAKKEKIDLARGAKDEMINQIIDAQGGGSPKVEKKTSRTSKPKEDKGDLAEIAETLRELADKLDDLA